MAKKEIIQQYVVYMKAHEAPKNTQRLKVQKIKNRYLANENKNKDEVDILTQTKKTSGQKYVIRDKESFYIKI